MSKTLMMLSAGALALATALPVHAEGVDADTVVATVNGTEITLGHMILVRSGLPDQYQQLPADVLWDGILDQLIQQEAMAQDDRAQETKRVELAMANERRSLLAAEAITAVAEQAVTEDAIQQAYEAQYVNGDPGQEYNASHILVETREEAEAILAEVKGGADFAETAKAKSTGPSGPNGGSLGWFSAGMMVEPFQAAVEAMEAGDVTGPVQTQFGWHVIRLNETRTKEAPELEEVREQIIGAIQQEAVQGYIEDVVAQSEVARSALPDLDPSVLTDTDLLEE